MLNEYKRIKDGYDRAIEKIENRMKELLTKQENDYSNKLIELELKYQNNNRNC